MKPEYTIEAQTGIVRACPRGSVGIKNIVQLIEALATDPDVPKPVRELWDGTDVEHFDLSTPDIQHMVGVTKRRIEAFSGGWLVLVAPTPLMYGMGRVAMAFTEALPFDFAIFRERDEADAWIAARLDADGDRAKPD